MAALSLHLPTGTDPHTVSRHVARATSDAAAVSVSSASARASASAAAGSASSAMRAASSALSSAQRVATNVAQGQAPQTSDQGNPSWFQYVGLALAILSGVLIGVSFVVKKLGLLAAQKKYQTTPGEGMRYLRSARWWCGMILMILGELCNLGAYSFADAVIVTPMGALSVVISAILSSLVLKEKLSLFGWLGCALCILGSTTIALNAPSHSSSGRIEQFMHQFIAPGFLVWVGMCLVTAIVLIIFAVPRWGKTHMLVHISICSIIGGLSVSVTTGLGGALLLSIQGQNQMKHWFVYFLLVFVAVTLVTEVIFLNKALELFNTAMVTRASCLFFFSYFLITVLTRFEATYYVIFTFASLVSTIILDKGLSAPATGIASIVCAFLTICIGITVLQLSKLDPKDLAKQPGLDRRTTLLLRASRSYVRPRDEEKVITRSESPSANFPYSDVEQNPTHEVDALLDPGPETIRGTLGVVGSIIRARSVARSRRSKCSARSGHASHHFADDRSTDVLAGGRDADGQIRYQLYDEPVLHSTLSRVPEDEGALASKPHLSVPAPDHGILSPHSQISTEGPERKVTFTHAALEHARSGQSTFTVGGLNRQRSHRSTMASAGSFYRRPATGDDFPVEEEPTSPLIRGPSARSTAARAGSFSRPGETSDTSLDSQGDVGRRSWKSVLSPRRRSQGAQHAPPLALSRPKEGNMNEPMHELDDWGYVYHSHNPGKSSLASLLLKPMPSEDGPNSVPGVPDDGAHLDREALGKESMPSAPNDSFEGEAVKEDTSSETDSLSKYGGGHGTGYRDTTMPAFYYDDTNLPADDSNTIGLALRHSSLARPQLELHSEDPASAANEDVNFLAPPPLSWLNRNSAPVSGAPSPPHTPLTPTAGNECAYAVTGVVDAYGYADSAPPSLRARRLSGSPVLASPSAPSPLSAGTTARPSWLPSPSITHSRLRSDEEILPEPAIRPKTSLHR